jgi:hypothetical protein
MELMWTESVATYCNAVARVWLKIEWFNVYSLKSSVKQLAATKRLVA